MLETGTVSGHETNGTAEKGTQTGRDVRGRFTKGNAGGPGNPFARQTARLRQVMLDEVSEDDLRDIVRAVKQCAREGDMTAAKLLLAYCIGQPTPAVDPDRLDVQEVKLYQEQAIDPQMMQAAMRRVPADLACGLLDAGIEATRRTMTGHLGEQMRQRFPQDFEDGAQPAQQEASQSEERVEKEAARRQARKEARQARQAQETPEQREARKAAAREAARAARQKRAEEQARRDKELPTVEQILAWARQGPEAALAEVRAVNKPAQTDGGSPDREQ